MATHVSEEGTRVPTSTRVRSGPGTDYRDHAHARRRCRQQRGRPPSRSSGHEPGDVPERRRSDPGPERSPCVAGSRVRSGAACRRRHRRDRVGRPAEGRRARRPGSARPSRSGRPCASVRDDRGSSAAGLCSAATETPHFTRRRKRAPRDRPRHSVCQIAAQCALKPLRSPLIARLVSRVKSQVPIASRSASLCVSPTDGLHLI